MFNQESDSEVFHPTSETLGKPDKMSPPRVDSSTIPRTLRTSESLDLNDAITLDVKNESKVRLCKGKNLSVPRANIYRVQVLVLYTGGTIGMVRNSEGALAPQPQAMESMIR